MAEMPIASDGDAAVAIAPPPVEVAREETWFERTFVAMRDSNYRWFYVGNVLQFGSMNMQLVVRGWLVFQLTGSFALLGTMSLANALPTLVFSPIGGVVADRATKKTVIQIAQGYNAINAALLAILAGGLFGLHLEFWHLFLSAFLQGVINATMQPARQSFISDIVPRDRLTNAIGLNASGQTMMQLVAPAAAGFMIAAISPGMVFGVMAAMYVIAVMVTSKLPAKPLYAYQRGPDAAQMGGHGRPMGGRRGGGSLKDLVAGFKYVAGEPTIRTVIMVNFLIVIVAMPYTMLLPGFVRSVLCIEPFCSARQAGAMQGTMQSIQGVGALAGAMFVASSGPKYRGVKFLLCGALLGAGILAFAASGNYLLTLAIMVVIGAGQASRMALGQVLIQSYAEDQYRGRVMSVWFMEFGLVQFGTFFVGLLAQAVGPQLAIGSLAALLVLAMGILAVTAPIMRRLD